MNCNAVWAMLSGCMHICKRRNSERDALDGTASAIVSTLEMKLMLTEMLLCPGIEGDGQKAMDAWNKATVTRCVE